MSIWKHIFRVAAVTGVGIIAAVGADLIWPESDADIDSAVSESEETMESESTSDSE